VEVPPEHKIFVSRLVSSIGTSTRRALQTAGNVLLSPLEAAGGGTGGRGLKMEKPQPAVSLYCDASARVMANSYSTTSDDTYEFDEDR
jgi:hypothetical protein